MKPRGPAPDATVGCSCDSPQAAGGATLRSRKSMERDLEEARNEAASALCVPPRKPDLIRNGVVEHRVRPRNRNGALDLRGTSDGRRDTRSEARGGEDRNARGHAQPDDQPAFGSGEGCESGRLAGAGASIELRTVRGQRPGRFKQPLLGEATFHRKLRLTDRVLVRGVGVMR